jgi:hypothetical protein
LEQPETVPVTHVDIRAVTVAIGAIVVAAGLAVSGAGQASQEPAGERVPVLVELFTSEGCSSCPPADDVLTKLVTTQPVAGAEIIALGEHVDYWDRLGWRDPFSSAAFTARQSDYAAKAFRAGSVYTPQMVVNGREEFVGSDYRAATATIARAVSASTSAPGRPARKAEPRLRLSINAEHRPEQASVRVSTRVEAREGSAPVAAAADLFLAIVENGLVTEVKRGENGGRRLRHSAVVRILTSVATVDSKPLSAETSLQFRSDWNADRSRVVAFVQERATRKVLGAATGRVTY